MTKRVQQYGTWPSPLSPKMMAGSLRLNDVQWDTHSDTLVWHEGRGAQGVLVMQRGDDAPRDLTSDLSVRALVGYGGGDFTVAHGHVIFAGPNGRLYRQSLDGGSAKPITPAFGAVASPRVSADGRWVAYVYSYDHDDGIAVVDVEGKLWPVKVASGTDFVMQPAWHPKNAHLAYVAWNHPQMPWDGTHLNLLTLANDELPHVTASETVAGSDTVAIFQPEFSPDGRYLAYVGDATGWGQLYLYDLEQRAHKMVTESEAEHSEPAWGQGQRVFGWSHDGKNLYFAQNDQGVFSLLDYNTRTGETKTVKPLADYTSLGQIAASPRRHSIALIASSSAIPARVITYTPDEDVPPALSLSDEGLSMQVLADDAHHTVRIHKRSSPETLLPAQIAVAQPITWTGHDGEDVYGLYYAPTNDQYEGVSVPPLIVKIHGGPTSQVDTGYDASAQFFASRGYAVLDVNYRGSTGYGKAYMNKLQASWGIYDVEDAATGALHLADTGRADRSKFVILGGSAGGFTVLQSLVVKPGFYKAGVCLFGVANQFLLAMETHKFEERYLDSILGPLPQAAALYRERSPIFHVEKIVDPLIVYQGEDDKVVPRNQSDSIVASLRARNVPHEYHLYPGEGHGWRKPETIEAYYTSLTKFLQQHVLFA